MVWYIWWLAALAFVLALVCVGIRACDDESEFIIPAADVARIEAAHLGQITAADMHDMRDFQPVGPASGAPLPGRA